jgi:hypothetical protein
VRVRTSLDLWRLSQINHYLLCAVVSKQARRLGRLIPEMRVPELIGVALRNCAEHRLEVQIDSNTPEVIREEAACMFSMVDRSGVSVSAATSAGSQAGNGASNLGQQAGDENIPEKKGAALSTAQVDIHISVGADIQSPDSCCNLPSLPREYSMSNTNGTDRIRQLQLRAFAENLYLLANRHRENGNYVVAHALFGRALEAARSVDTPEHKENGSALVAKIQKDQQVVFEALRSSEGNWAGALLGKGQKAGQ